VTVHTETEGCVTWVSAQRIATIWRYHASWLVDTELLPIVFCPWCGESLKQNTPHVRGARGDAT